MSKKDLTPSLESWPDGLKDQRSTFWVERQTVIGHQESFVSEQQRCEHVRFIDSLGMPSLSWQHLMTLWMSPISTASEYRE